MSLLRSTFDKDWAAMLWNAMTITGKGYHRPSLKRDGKGERRNDKIGTSSLMRRYQKRYT